MEKISNCEKLIMTVIWSFEEHPTLQSVMGKIRQLYGKEWKPQTVSTFISRLAKKGYLTIYRRGRYSYYMPLVSLQEFRSHILADIVQTLYSGNPKALEGQLHEMYGI